MNPKEIVRAQLTDADTIVALFGALHSYNASLDAYFTLCDDWESLLRREFRATWQQGDRL